MRTTGNHTGSLLIIVIGLMALGLALPSAASRPSPSSSVSESLSKPTLVPITTAHASDALTPQQQQRLLAVQQAALSELNRAGKLAPAKRGQPVLFDWPVSTAIGSRLTQRWGISNFVDHDAGFPDQLLDYMCGARTYDTADGYNHSGVDIFTWPAAWQAMAQDAQVVLAAASGVLIARQDGKFDRNCSFDAADDPNYVFIRQDDGSVAWYLHMKSGSVIDLPLGSPIAAGTRLGVVGSSGISTAPHLHFELHESNAFNAPVVDPFNGTCQAQPSRWTSQPDYRDPRITMAVLSSEPPEVNSACGTPENYHLINRAEAGEQVLMVSLYRDMYRNSGADLEVLRPDGSVALQQSFPFAGFFGVEDYFNAAYLYLPYTLPPDAMAGIWHFRWTYNGVLHDAPLLVGDIQLQASGGWYNPSQSGHGLLLEVINGGGEQPLLGLTWYAYHDGQPLWLTGLAPITAGATTVSVYQFTGGEFPPHFDPTEVQPSLWGTVQFSPADVNNATISWTPAQPGYEAGSQAMTRITLPSDINTDGFNSGIRACMSGGWYNPSQSGQGLFAEVIGTAENRLLAVAWYAYHNGKPYWLTGAGPITGNQAEISLAGSTQGEFPPDFDPGQSAPSSWGTLTWRFDSPNASHIEWDAALAGFEDGAMDLSRITALADAPCL